MNPTSKLGIICAMEEELAPIRAKLAEAKLERRVTLARSGVGKVNAAIAAMKLIAAGVTHVLVCGVAGGLDAGLKVGDIVLAKDAIQHDIEATALGFQVGDIPLAEQSVWPADADMNRLVLEAARNADIPVLPGRMLTGDQFVANRRQRQRLREAFMGTCIDMETAAVAQACAAHGVPWTAIRVMSDSANEASPDDFQKFLASASKRVARIITEVAKRFGNSDQDQKFEDAIRDLDPDLQTFARDSVYRDAHPAPRKQMTPSQVKRVFTILERFRKPLKPLDPLPNETEDAIGPLPLPRELQQAVDAAPTSRPKIDVYFVSFVEKTWSDPMLRTHAYFVYFQDETPAPQIGRFPNQLKRDIGYFAAEMRVKRDATRLIRSEELQTQ